ncbi:MAG: hypothetical protein IPJ84_15530 [Bdellovibrionales bacterium]|nr:hypothetical protein [Bdellovibrionales bacterium]
MSDKNWFEEKPTDGLSSQIQRAAEHELERRGRLSQTERRRLLDFAWLTPLAFAALAGIWFTWRNDKTETTDSSIADLELLAIEVADIDLLVDADSDYEFFDDLDVLEEITDEDFNV